MFPRRYAPVLFALILSGLMSLLVAGVSTWRLSGGFGPGFVDGWLHAWWSAWLLAFPTVMVVAPLTRRLVARLT